MRSPVPESGASSLLCGHLLQVRRLSFQSNYSVQYEEEVLKTPRRLRLFCWDPHRQKTKRCCVWWVRGSAGDQGWTWTWGPFTTTCPSKRGNKKNRTEPRTWKRKWNFITHTHTHTHAHTERPRASVCTSAPADRGSCTWPQEHPGRSWNRWPKSSWINRVSPVRTGCCLKQHKREIWQTLTRSVVRECPGPPRSLKHSS